MKPTLWALSWAFFLLGCQGSVPPGPEKTDLIKPVSLINPTGESPTYLELAGPGDLNTLVEGNNQFALDLYQHLSREEGNIFFSPYSISSALAMAYAGARGEIAAQMAAVLHFSLEPKKLHPTFADLNRQINGAKKAKGPQLDIANALWGQKGYPFYSDYLRLVRDYYGGALGEVDFLSNPEGAREAINLWVSERTRKKIPDLLAPGMVDSKTRLVLTNALYFKSFWESSFSEQYTRDEDFFLTPHNRVKVPMMAQQKVFPYYQTEDLQIVELPYQGGNWSLVVLLPKEGKSLRKIEDSLATGTLKEWLASLKTKELRIYMPKYKILGEYFLKRELSSLGLPLFPLEGISKEKLQIQEVIHKSFMEVSEEGTEAAGATAIIDAAPDSSSGGLPTSSVPIMEINRPFLFYIRDRASKSILFMGRVMDPRKVF